MPVEEVAAAGCSIDTVAVDTDTLVLLDREVCRNVVGRCAANAQPIAFDQRSRTISRPVAVIDGPDEECVALLQ